MSEVAAWKQGGRLSLWHYTENERNYPGWHLTADQLGASSLASLLRVLQQSDVPGDCTLTLTAPSADVLAVPNNRGGRAGFRAPSKWRFVYRPGADSARIWAFAESRAGLALTLGSEGLKELVTGVEGIPRGKGDYSIRLDGNEPLWFWWWPKGHVA